MPAERGYRPDQKFLQLRTAFLVAPVADPDEVAFQRRRLQGPEAAHIRSFVPDPGKPGPARAHVAVRDALTKCQYAGIVTEVERFDSRWVGDAAMMRVVEEQAAARARRAFAEPIDQSRIIPFVHQRHVRAGERPLAVEVRERVAMAAQLGKAPREFIHGRTAFAHEQVAQAPALGGFVDLHFVPARQQLAGAAAQEVRVAVVPVGHQRMIEERELHATARLSGRDPLDSSRYNARYCSHMICGR
jgi:hypothetical protein